MPYRSPSTVCIVWSESTNQSCHSCDGLHCPAHLIDGSCAGCVATLWQLERSQVGTATVLYTALALPAFLVAGLSLGWAFAAPLAVGYFALSSGVRRSVRSVLRRKLADRKLLPTATAEITASRQLGVR